MKSYTFIPLILIGVLLFVFAACHRETGFLLEKTIFIEDQSCPRLPIYSEWGYNTFGAYKDREPFVSDNRVQPAKVEVKNDTCRLHFYGYWNNVSAKLIFSFPDFNPETYEDLLFLDKKTFNLKDKTCLVSWETGNYAHEIRIIDGELNFKRAQKLYVDREITKTILSGTFQFKAVVEKQPVAVTNGRFDLGIGYNNFFCFK